MNCIIVNDELSARNEIKLLINQTDNLTLLASFSNTFEASRFIAKNTVDLIFFDIQIDEKKSYTFVKAIPCQTFVIFISGFMSCKAAYIINRKVDRFREAVARAKNYSNVEKTENSTFKNDYFVI